MVNSLENIDKSKVSADRITGLDQKIQEELSTAITGAASTIITTDLTANKILVSNSNGKVAASAKALTDKQDTLVSGTNIKTINNTSILGSGNISISTTPSIDNKSITTNGSSQLQTVGVINQQSTSTAIKTWVGTKQQFDGITTKDSNTLYNITDDTDFTFTLLEVMYPVGAIYIGTMNACPLQVLGVGTWQLVSSGRVLQGVSSGQTTGTIVEAGLPNIEGTTNSSALWHNDIIDDSTGAFSREYINGSYVAGNANQNYSLSLTFDASLSNPIYGNSTTVQPPAYLVNIWERIQ